MGVQIAASMGLRVFGTASTANHDRIRALGAEPVAYGDGLAERVRALAPGGVDVVVDFVGGVLDATVAVLAPGGRHASIADDSVIGAGGSWMWVRPSATDLTHLAALVESGDVQVPIAGVFDLDQLPEAFDASRGGRTQGKLVVRVSAD
jgi:NADPH:quinone reductase-like Zn-dependent oxidoreductase